MLADTVRTWVAGWAVSRRTPSPVAQPWGFYIAVTDNPAEVGRHVLPEAEESLVRDAAASVTVPRTWMKTRRASRRPRGGRRSSARQRWWTGW
ncbi:hypothetical protein [Streptomyces sp. NPDC051684]|uniref:hypothetical protein n=1 Tax=Streptomyces sp. NPDC051684 TaxID=3365670 RepID=UPI0037A4D4F8